MFRPLCKILPAIMVSSLLLSSARADTLPNITAQSWLIADASGNVLEGIHTTEIRSIASITKLMTVMVVVDSGQLLHETINKKLYNKNMSRKELIQLALVKSDNNAARLLCESYPGGEKKCVEAMNTKAQNLNMVNTKFMDPTGLHQGNTSTAIDLINLVHAASTYSIIVEYSNTPTIIVAVDKKKPLLFRNTNSLIDEKLTFFVSKTGFINKSGGCIVMMLETINGVRTVILLGSKNTKTRIPEAKLLSTLY